MEGVATKALGDLALQGAGWTVAVLLAIVLAWTLLRYMSLLERVIVVAETNKAASDASVKAQEAVKIAISAVADAMQELSRETEGEARETRHTLNNLAAILQSNASILDRLLNRGRAE